MSANRNVRLGLTAMEDRYAPAGVVSPLVTHGFNPQPEPPVAGTVRTATVAQPATRGIIIEGGAGARGIIIEGSAGAAGARGIIIEGV